MSLEHPNYFNAQDRARYEHLFYHNNNNLPLTTIEENFVTAMYHMEEVACGLDGDLGEVYDDKEDE